MYNYDNCSPIQGETEIDGYVIRQAADGRFVLFRNRQKVGDFSTFAEARGAKMARVRELPNNRNRGAKDDERG